MHIILLGLGVRAVVHWRAVHRPSTLHSRLYICSAIVFRKLGFMAGGKLYAHRAEERELRRR